MPAFGTDGAIREFPELLPPIQPDREYVADCRRVLHESAEIERIVIGQVMVIELARSRGEVERLRDVFDIILDPNRCQFRHLVMDGFKVAFAFPQNWKPKCTRTLAVRDPPISVAKTRNNGERCRPDGLGQQARTVWHRSAYPP